MDTGEPSVTTIGTTWMQQLSAIHWATLVCTAVSVPVCQHILCLGLAISVQLAFFGEGKGIIWFDDVDCAGDEETVFNCSHRGAGVENCHHREDAGVICQSEHPLYRTSHLAKGISLFRYPA